MQIRDIFQLPIERQINPAVVVSNVREATVKAEIEEYVLTDQLLELVYRFLNTFITKKDGKTGIWVNGYYGSGKSHFIKFIHYCINPATSDRAFDHYLKYVSAYKESFTDVTVSNVIQLKKKVQELHMDDIIFNVEDETDDGSGERLTRIFLNMFNRFRGYNADDIPLALLFEKYLDSKGVLEKFQQVLAEKHGFNWKEQAADVASYELKTILEVAKSLVPEMDVQSLHTKLSHPETYKVGIISTLIPELREFLRGKSPGYRLLFLVDEVSQYIGTNKEILLNFQSIIERVSEDCNNQVWIACTAQQTLEEVSIGTGSSAIKDEFGKILGRFDTRIPLASTDASYITQKRVLNKNGDGVKILGQVYKKNQDAIENQFKMHHELYKGYQSEDDFILAYPFVPYQFKLIASVFDAFQNLQYVIKEVKDNERSVISITHFTAKKNASQVVGQFIPFDAFYNEQFSTNLTQRGRRAIENAITLSCVQQDPFAQRVVKALFMISNLSDAIRMTFPSNIDNLTTLLMDSVDQNKLQLQKKIREVLEKLTEENIIREEKNSFFFFSEDERDLTNLIKNQVVNFDDRLDILDHFIRPLLKVDSKHRLGKRDFKVGYAMDDKEYIRNGDVKATVVMTDQKDIHERALNNPVSELLICCNEWYNRDTGLKKDMDWYTKSEKYFRTNADGATGERLKTIETFKMRNQSLSERIVERLKLKLPETRFVSGQQVIESSDVNGTKIPDRYHAILERHIGNVFRYYRLADDYAATAMELRIAASSPQAAAPFLTPAEQTVDDFISTNGNTITVHDLVRHFSVIPFGWPDTAILHMLVQLNKKKRREFEYSNQPRYPIREFIEKALSTAERTRCVVKAGEEIDQSTIDDTLRAYREIFNEDLKFTNDGNKLYDDLLEKLNAKFNHYREFEEKLLGKYPFGTKFQEITHLLDDWRQTRDPRRLFGKMTGNVAPAKTLIDTCKTLVDFTGKTLDIYDRIRKFYHENTENFRTLSEEDLEKANQIGEYMKSDEPAGNFRHIMKYNEELKDALDNLTKELKQKALKVYSEVFDELEKEMKQSQVEEPHVIADRKTVLQRIENLKGISELKLRISEAQNFKLEQIRIILAYGTEGTGDQSETYHISGITNTIKTEEELLHFLDCAKDQMTEILKRGKTIIIK